MQKENQPLQGLYQKENGKEYYQWLIEKQIGCILSVPEILNKLEIDFEKNLYTFRYLQEKIQTFPNFEKLIEEPF